MGIQETGQKLVSQAKAHPVIAGLLVLAAVLIGYFALRRQGGVSGELVPATAEGEAGAAGLGGEEEAVSLMSLEPITGLIYPEMGGDGGGGGTSAETVDFWSDLNILPSAITLPGGPTMPAREYWNIGVKVGAGKEAAKIGQPEPAVAYITPSWISAFAAKIAPSTTPITGGRGTLATTSTPVNLGAVAGAAAGAVTSPAPYTPWSGVTPSWLTPTKATTPYKPPASAGTAGQRAV